MGSLGLKNIHMSFGNNQVLTDINLEVDDGEFVIFVGPSGCGKSTLLRIIAGLETPVSGDVEISGQLVNAMPAS
ncbi:MAG: ATP-binding cassette domain-containing protein, partial [Candidatus Puniceispirillaceae bacterium]